ncbi:MAG: aminotransferase class I/II-fold pyridoxal phosphate-dependent enzyme [Chloroflexota bacterium]
MEGIFKVTSQTKAAILQQHETNTLLNAAAPSLTRQSAHDLSVDEANAPLDERIIATVGQALDDGQTHYVPVPGIDPLREALAEYLNGAAGTSLAKDNVLVTAGVQESRFLTIQLMDYQHLGIPAVVHPGAKRALGVRDKAHSTMAVDPSSQLPTLDAIKAAAEGDCDMLYLESPSRLTGAAYKADELTAIADIATSNNCGVIWDQGLMPWAQGAPSLLSVEGAAEYTAVIGEAFPGTGLASWFISYIAAPTGWIPPMQKQKQVMAICTSTPSQYGALEAASLFADMHAARMEKLSDVRGQIMTLAAQAGLAALDGETISVVAFQMPTESKDATLATLAEAGYTVADGADFGAANVMRLAVTLDGAAVDAIKVLAG